MEYLDIQKKIADEGAQAWIIYDYECNNPALISLLGKRFLTRKCFFIIPTIGKPYIICHKIDEVQLKDIKNDIDIITYVNWTEMMKLIKQYVSQYHIVLAEISECGLMPHSSYDDYGTIVMLKSFGVDVLPSANLAQTLVAPFFGASFDSFIWAANKCNEIKDKAFDFIGLKIKQNGKVSEYEVQQYILRLFAENGMVTDSDPIVALGCHANDPHYAPSKGDTDFIKENDLVLIDLWAKKNDDKAVFGDITWMAYVGNNIPEKYVNRFNIIKESIDVTLAFLNKELALRCVKGYEVDDVCRNVINKNGFGNYFIHRTGHSISFGESPHGLGVNIDNFETHDERTLIDGVAFSIEPGIYAPDFGMREEIDVYVHNKHAIVASPRQESIICIHID